MGDKIDTPKILPVKSDIIFRMFFTDERNKEELIGLLKAVLEIPEDDYDEIEIADPYLLPEYAEQIGSGGNYNEIENVISIIITDKTLVQDSAEYHHRFTFYDNKAGTEFTDLVEINTLELNQHTPPQAAGYVVFGKVFDSGYIPFLNAPRLACRGRQKVCTLRIQSKTPPTIRR